MDFVPRDKSSSLTNRGLLVIQLTEGPVLLSFGLRSSHTKLLFPGPYANVLQCAKVRLWTGSSHAKCECRWKWALVEKQTVQHHSMSVLNMVIAVTHPY